MILKPWLPLLTLSVTLALAAEPAKACAWDDTYGSRFYSFFPPALNNFKALEAFHFSYDRLYNYDLLEPQASTNANLSDWQKYFGKSADQAQLLELVYGSEAEDLRGTLSFIDGKRGNPVPKFKDMPLMTELKAGKYREAIEYLYFAKQTEPLVVGYDSWEEEEAANPKDAEKRAEEALSALRKAKAPLIKLRYAYQAVRLYHYHGFEKEAIRTFEAQVKPLKNTGSLIYWWSLSDYAGAHRNLGQEVEAAYNFGLVWENCPSRRIQAWYGWRILSDEIWANVLDRCQNDHERAVQYFLRAFSPDALAIEDIAMVAKLEPNSTLTELLIIREINKLEASILGWPYNQTKPFYQGFRPNEYDQSGTTISELHDFVKLTLRDAKLQDKDFWVLADAYLSFLSSDFTAAQSKLQAAMPTLQPDAKLRASFIELAIRIATTRSANPASEASLYADVTKLRSQLDEENATHLASFLDEGMAWLYEQQKDQAKALLARNGYYRLWEKSSVEQVDAMIEFAKATKVNPYQQMLATRMYENPLNSLTELRGTRLLAGRRFEEAVKVFESLPQDYRKSSTSFTLKADPFQGRLVDIVHCDENGCEDNRYDKLSFAKRVLELQQKTVSDRANAARYHLELGHAFYNITFFGPAWQALDYFRSGGSWYYFGEHSEWYDFDPNNFDEVIDMELAEQHYNQAKELAKDKELAAEACFYAAKCEQNRGYIAGGDMNAYRDNFEQLNTTYRYTSFAKQAVQECKYYGFYVNR